MSPCQGSPLTATDVSWQQLFRVYRMGVVTVYRGMGFILGYRGKYLGIAQDLFWGEWRKGRRCRVQSGLGIRRVCVVGLVCVQGSLCLMAGVELWASGVHMPDSNSGDILGVGEHSYWIQ